MMDAFKGIYENAHWGESRLYAGYGGSGFGSSVQFVRELILHLQRYIAENQISSFLDVGCGECEWQRVIDWEALECKYIGIELSSDVVKRVRSDLADRKNMTFIQGNCLDMTLPATDVAFVKEVCQHLPIRLTNDLLEKLCATSKHCLTYNCDASSSFLRYSTYRYFISKQREVHDEVVDDLVEKLRQIHWDADAGGFRPCNFDVYGTRLATFKWKWHFPASLIRIDRVARDLETQCLMFTHDNLCRQIEKITGGLYPDTDIFPDERAAR